MCMHTWQSQLVFCTYNPLETARFSRSGSASQRKPCERVPKLQWTLKHIYGSSTNKLYQIARHMNLPCEQQYPNYHCIKNLNRKTENYKGHNCWGMNIINWIGNNLPHCQQKHPIFLCLTSETLRNGHWKQWSLAKDLGGRQNRFRIPMQTGEKRKNRKTKHSEPAAIQFQLTFLYIKLTCRTNKCKVQGVEKEDHVFLPNVVWKLDLKNHGICQEKKKIYTVLSTIGCLI